MNHAPYQQDRHLGVPVLTVAALVRCPFLAEQRLPAKSHCPLIARRQSMEKAEDAEGAVELISVNWWSHRNP